MHIFVSIFSNATIYKVVVEQRCVKVHRGPGMKYMKKGIESSETESACNVGALSPLQSPLSISIVAYLLLTQENSLRYIPQSSQLCLHSACQTIKAADLYPNQVQT